MRVDAIFGALGRFSVRFRWLMALAWVVGAAAAVALLPPLSSVTQNDNTKFLPASAPTERALALAKPFGTAGLQPVPVLAGRSSGALTAADTAALAGLQRRLRQVPRVVRIIDLGESADHHAQELVVLAAQSVASSQTAAPTLIGNLRSAIAAAGLPAGLHAHLAGGLAVAVDQQKANGSQGSQIQDFSALFIIVLLVLIFRSLTLALVTLIPAVVSVEVAGPLVAEAAQHGLKVSPLAQFLLIVLVLGAGTDYGLFLVFRVREQLRVAKYDGGPVRTAADGSELRGFGGMLRGIGRDLRRPRDPAKEAIVTSVTRVGESITFSGATVIAAVLTLLLASFPFYADLGIPFGIAIGVILAAALTLLPALLSIRLSLLGVKRTIFQVAFGRPKLIPWNIQGTGKAGFWGKTASRIVGHPGVTLVAGVIFFGGLALGVLGYTAAGFGGNNAPPAGSDSAAGASLLAKHFPQSSANPTIVILRYNRPVWADPAVLGAATSYLSNSLLFTKAVGPLNPVGPELTPAQFELLYKALGPPRSLASAEPAGTGVPKLGYELYRATGNYVSTDGRTIEYAVGLTAGDPGGTPALKAIPSVRTEVTRVARATHALAWGVIGQAPALYDISNVSNSDLQRIVPIAILAIGLLLALVLRSLVAPLYLIASVGISYLAALGLAVLLFVKLGHSGGLVFFLPFLMFIFLLALGEDYNILVMTRIREEAHRLPLREAVAKALTVTGTTVTSAGLVLAGTFGVLAVVAGRGSGGSSFRDIGLGLAFGILMDTFLVRTLLVPSTVVLLGRWNWWPSRLTVGEPDASAESITGESALPGARSGG